MKNEGFDQLAYARRIRSAGRPIHIPRMTARLAACLPTPCGYVKQAGSSRAPRSIGAPRGFKINLVVTSKMSGFAVSRVELNFRGSRPFSGGLKIPR